MSNTPILTPTPKKPPSEAKQVAAKTQPKPKTKKS